MNKDIFQGNWNEIKGKIKQQWGKLTDDKITTINGKYDVLVGLLQQSYGYQREQAQKEIDTFLQKNRWTEKTE